MHKAPGLKRKAIYITYYITSYILWRQMCLKCYSLVIDQKLVKEIDRLIKEHGLYSSRSDFIRDAIRARLIEVKKTVLEQPEEKPSKKKAEKEERNLEEALEELDEHKYGGVH